MLSNAEILFEIIEFIYFYPFQNAEESKNSNQVCTNRKYGYGYCVGSTGRFRKKRTKITNGAK